jgi:hypothetical protein
MSDNLARDKALLSEVTGKIHFSTSLCRRIADDSNIGFELKLTERRGGCIDVASMERRVPNVDLIEGPLPLTKGKPTCRRVGASVSLPGASERRRRRLWLKLRTTASLFARVALIAKKSQRRRRR